MVFSQPGPVRSISHPERYEMAKLGRRVLISSNIVVSTFDSLCLLLDESARPLDLALPDPQTRIVNGSWQALLYHSPGLTLEGLSVPIASTDDAMVACRPNPRRRGTNEEDVAFQIY